MTEALQANDLTRTLQSKEHEVEQLRAQVQQLKAHVQDVHTRYEGDVQHTVASLQEQYNAALELMQLGLGLGSDGQTTGAVKTTGLDGPWRSSSGAPASARPAQLAQQSGTGTCCKCVKGTGNHAHGCCKRPCKANGLGGDPRVKMLGLSPDDISPAAAYGASVGLNLEPVALLRDVLNLDGAHGPQREWSQHKPFSAVSAAAGVSGPTLAQAQFEARLRGAYRSMLMQLQHRYMLERERQEEMHKIQLQEQAERHSRELRERTSTHEAERVQAAQKLEREAAARRMDVKRLEGQLMELNIALEASREQAEAARAAADTLRAQLELQRSTHEAELQHVLQGSISLQQHEEVVRRMKAEWEAALQQRERDFSSLLAELTELRRQLSSASGAPSRSSEGSGSYNGPSAAPPRAGGPDKAPPEPEQLQPPQAVASGHAAQAATRHADASAQQHQGRAAQQQHGQQQGGRRGGGGGPGAEERRPGSPTPSGHSVALSVDEMGSAVLEVSEDTAAPTPQSRAAWAAHEHDLPPRPPSAASSRLSELVDAVMGSGPQQQQQQYQHGLGRGAADGPGGPRADSPDRTSSELTLGGWRAATTANDGDRRSASPARLSPRRPGPVGQERSAPARPASARPIALSPRADAQSGSAPPAAAGGRAGRPTSPLGGPPLATRSVKPSQWGTSGNPAAAVNMPKCMRCGLNDATSPGCCRFHPALLSQPGSLMFTPEWMACQAAGHTDRTAGCLIRTEHFYAPLPMKPAAATKAGQTALPGASAPGAAGGAGGAAAARKPGGTAAAAQPARVPPRSRSPRAGSSPDPSPPRVGPQRATGVGSTAARAGGLGGGAGSAGSGGGGEPPRGGDGTPSPRPRTRLPSPLRR